MTVPYPMNFARACGEPVVMGELRVAPADFLVEEDLGFVPSGAGEHVFLLVRKVGANTDWVARQLALHFGVREFDVTYSGRKDRHAETTQWFGVWLPGKTSVQAEDIKIEGVTVVAVSRHNKKLRRGSHLANRFMVRLRHVVGLPEELPSLQARIAQIQDTGFPNYFGEQRFGHGGANLVNANRMFEGRQVERNRRDLYLSAARSYLFNCELSRRVADGSCYDGRQGWLAGTSRKGDAVFDREPEFEPWYSQFEQLGIKAIRRDLMVIPDGLTARLDGSDLLLAFCLPTGSYATSLLRELVIYTNRSGPGDE
ncbi:MAG: tRNA pseudouridine(13) synthase TruD [Pseudomonadota bacterium]